MKARLGIISPSGDFYPCAYGCHEALAIKIGRPLGFQTQWDHAYDMDLADKGMVGNTMVDTLCKNGYVTFGITGWSQSPAVYGVVNSRQQDTVDSMIMAWMSLNETEIADAAHCNDEGLSCDSRAIISIKDLKAFRERLMMEHSDNAHVPGPLITPIPGINYYVRGQKNGD